MIIVPRIVSPTTGLVFRSGSWYAIWTVTSPGKPDRRPIRSLKTEDLAKATAARDELFAGLLSKRGSRTGAKGVRRKKP